MEFGAAQIQSLAAMLALITPIHRPPPTLVRCQEPLHIGAAQCNIFEGIDPLLNIGRNGAPLGQETLAGLIDLRLGAPGLAHTLPVCFPGHTVVEQAHIHNFLRRLQVLLLASAGTVDRSIGSCWRCLVSTVDCSIGSCWRCLMLSLAIHTTSW